MKSFAFCAGTVLALALAAATPPAAELPVETFFRKPTFSNVEFSPDGGAIAMLQSIEGQMNLVVLDLDTKVKTLLTNFRDQEVAAYSWAGDKRLAFVLDTKGDEFFGLYVVGRDGKGFRELSGTAEVQIKQGKMNPRPLYLFAELPDDPDHFLVLDDGRFQLFPDVYRISLRSGRKNMVVANPGNVSSWLTDNKGVVRIGIAVEPGSTSVIYRDGEGKDWETIHTGGVDEFDWWPLGFDGDNRTLFIASGEGRKTSAIFRYDTITRKTEPAPVLEDPIYDVDGIRYWRSLNKVVGCSYQADKPRTHWLDPACAKNQAIVDAALPGARNVISEASPDGKLLLINSYSDREPGVYYLMDLGRRQIQELAVTREWIDPEKMAPMKPVQFDARDGLSLHGYLTIPVGREPRALPMILLPHGGPYGIRDTWRFDPEIQFLANRGYAVLQVNFRGSGGYGHGFEQAGYRKWGEAMQDDLTDAVQWAVAEGYADPKRIVIMGGSYGGYAVMAGLAFTPELYQAGVNIVGVTDVELLLEGSSHWPEVRREAYALRIADRKADKERMKAVSPVYHAQSIRAPVFMAYGKNDPRVDIRHGASMERALKREGKTFEYFVRPDEGHGYRKEQNAFELYSRIDAFLNRYAPAD
jgi:dipeptidyl aminopeptidase/acylaminoacyl peptidase